MPPTVEVKRRGTHDGCGRRGAVLLEVVFALGLFVAAATVIVSGLNSSFTAVDHLRRQVVAENLAASVVAEMQLGIRPLESTISEEFDAPFSTWTIQVEVSAETRRVSEEETRVGAETIQLEVVVRNPRHEVVHRLGAEILAPGEPETESGPSSASSTADSARIMEIFSE